MRELWSSRWCWRHVRRPNVDTVFVEVTPRPAATSRITGAPPAQPAEVYEQLRRCAGRWPGDDGDDAIPALSMIALFESGVDSKCYATFGDLGGLVEDAARLSYAIEPNYHP